MEPKIRLKGFQGEWEKVLIGKMGTTYSGLSGKTKEDFGFGDARFVTFLNVLTNAIINTSILEAVCVCEGEHQNEVRRGDLLFNTSSETPEEVGMCAVIDEELKNVYLNSFCFGFRVTDKNIDPTFIAYLMRSHIGRRIMSILAQGATRYNLSKNSFCKAELLLPKTKAEQQLISKYFTSIDSLIQSTTKKIESLKQVKAASLQSMFPQEGETTPRVRFKGFEGEWDISPLSTFAKKSTEKNSAMKYTITLTNSAEYGVINQSDFFDQVISNDDHTNGYYVIHNDDFVYNPRISATAPVGPINRNLLGYSGIMSPLYLIFKVENINKDFLSYFFKTFLWHNYMKLEGNTGARFDRLAISDAQFFNMPICVPKAKKEQSAIAEYFISLDSQITLQTQRLEKLKQIKSACLDNMFV